MSSWSSCSALIIAAALAEPGAALLLGGAPSPLRPRCLGPRAADTPPVPGEGFAVPMVPGAGPRTSMLPPPDDLADEELLKIVTEELADTEVNELIWKYLGYKRGAAGEWDNSGCFPNWRAKYPEPPDLVGVTRVYEREVDEPVLRAVQSLQRSVATEHKDNLRSFLRPLGWSGYKMDGLTPNKTRRAQVAQWLFYYRESLHGVPVEELKRRRDARAAKEEAARAAGERVAPTGTTGQSVI